MNCFLTSPNRLFTVDQAEPSDSKKDPPMLTDKAIGDETPSVDGPHTDGNLRLRIMYDRSRQF